MAAHLDVVIVVLYIVGMIAFGFVWEEEGPPPSPTFWSPAGGSARLYAGTMAAFVIGGARPWWLGLGYEHGLSGMWLVFCIGVRSALTAVRRPINGSGVYTVSQMLSCATDRAPTDVGHRDARLHPDDFGHLDDRIRHDLLGALRYPQGARDSDRRRHRDYYSALGGMWSITLTDFVQFVIKTIGIFLILLPIALWSGWLQGLAEELPVDAYSLTTMAADIVTYFVIYTFGLLIGQDIWQRVFTARSPAVARWAGTGAGAYCFLYARGGRAHRHGCQGATAYPRVARRRLRGLRRVAAAPGPGRAGARGGPGRGDVHLQRRAHRHRDGVPPGHRATGCATATSRSRATSKTT